MKVLVTGSQFPDSFTRNIVVTLQTMGHDVVSVRTTRAHHHQNRLAHAFWKYLPVIFSGVEHAAYRALLVSVATFQPDLVLLTYGIPPEILSQLRAASPAKIVCWFPDAISNYYRSYLIAGSYDGLFIKEPHLVPLLREKLGLNAYYLPEACNPMWHAPIALSDADRQQFGCDLAGIGSLHYYRARMLEPFVSYDLRIWGANCPPWLCSPIRAKYTGTFVAEQMKARALRAAKITLNIMYYTEVQGVNCSLFEAAGCGAFQITDWKPALPALFEPETEIVTFNTRTELKEKVDYYLAHPREREAIADRACRRAHHEHTYAHRLRVIFATVGLTQTRAANVLEGARSVAL